MSVTIARSAVLSEDGIYRYRLDRWWCDDKENRYGTRLVFVMLNPSTADADVDDPTIRRCMGFAQTLGFGGLTVVNLYALRATKPEALADADDPIGPDNERYHHEAIGQGGLTVAAWGAWKASKRMSLPTSVSLWRARRLNRLWCLGKTADGSPRHPLYVRADAQLQRWP